jgi:hypothetical protein
MKPQPNPFADTNTLLEHSLVNHDDNAKQHTALAEHQLVKTDEIGKEHSMLAEHQLVKTAEVVDTLKEILNKPEKMYPVTDMTETNNLLQKIVEEQQKICEVTLSLI